MPIWLTRRRVMTTRPTRKPNSNTSRSASASKNRRKQSNHRLWSEFGGLCDSEPACRRHRDFRIDIARQCGEYGYDVFAVACGKDVAQRHLLIYGRVACERYHGFPNVISSA